MGGIFPQSFFEALEHFARGFFHRGRIPTTLSLSDIRFEYVEWSKFCTLYFPKQRSIGFLRHFGLVSNEWAECASSGLCLRGVRSLGPPNTAARWSAAKGCCAPWGFSTESTEDDAYSRPWGPLGPREGQPFWGSGDSPFWEPDIPSGIYAVATLGQPRSILWTDHASGCKGNLKFASITTFNEQ